MQFTRLNDLDLMDKTVLIREDLNVPIQDGKITNDARLKASLPTIQLALQKGAGVMICSHLGRPTEGEFNAKYSLAPIVKYLSDHLQKEVILVDDYLTKPPRVTKGQVILLENVRFNVGEKKDDEHLAKMYADLADVYVMDAFGTAHRAQASTHGVIQAMQRQNKITCAGLLLAAELDALAKALQHPKKPMLAIVGGSKVSSKLDVLTSLAKICNQILVGGGIANTFLVAKGHAVGASLYEPDLVETAKNIMQQTDILLPEQVVVTKKHLIDFDNFLESLKNVSAITKSVCDIQADEMILDIAPSSAQNLAKEILQAKTILWNGPVGVFEVEQFSQGTAMIAKAIAESQGFSIAGGGDTLAAIDQYQIAQQIDYTSTGGGAFLEFVEGKPLPAVQALLQQSGTVC